MAKPLVKKSEYALISVLELLVDLATNIRGSSGTCENRFIYGSVTLINRLSVAHSPKGWF